MPKSWLTGCCCHVDHVSIHFEASEVWSSEALNTLWCYDKGPHKFRKPKLCVWTLTYQPQCFLVSPHQGQRHSCHLQRGHEQPRHHPGNHHSTAFYKKHHIPDYRMIVLFPHPPKPANQITSELMLSANKKFYSIAFINVPLWFLLVSLATHKNCHS